VSSPYATATTPSGSARICGPSRNVSSSSAAGFEAQIDALFAGDLADQAAEAGAERSRQRHGIA
jgi:hypothetical protein